MFISLEIRLKNVQKRENVHEIFDLDRNDFILYKQFYNNIVQCLIDKLTSQQEFIIDTMINYFFWNLEDEFKA